MLSRDEQAMLTNAWDAFRNLFPQHTFSARWDEGEHKYVMSFEGSDGEITWEGFFKIWKTSWEASNNFLCNEIAQFGL